MLNCNNILQLPGVRVLHYRPRHLLNSSSGQQTSCLLASILPIAAGYPKATLNSTSVIPPQRTANTPAPLLLLLWQSAASAGTSPALVLADSCPTANLAHVPRWQPEQILKASAPTEIWAKRGLRDPRSHLLGPAQNHTGLLKQLAWPGLALWRAATASLDR